MKSLSNGGDEKVYRNATPGRIREEIEIPRDYAPIDRSLPGSLAGLLYKSKIPRGPSGTQRQAKFSRSVLGLSPEQMDAGDGSTVT